MELMILANHSIDRLLRELLSATRDALSVIEAVEAAAIVPPDVTACCRAAFESGIEGRPDEMLPTTQLFPLSSTLQPIERSLYEIDCRLIACDIVVQAQRTLAALTR